MIVSNGKKNSLASYQMRVERARTIPFAISRQTHRVQLFQESFKHIIYRVSLAEMQCAHLIFLPWLMVF